MQCSITFEIIVYMIYALLHRSKKVITWNSANISTADDDIHNFRLFRHCNLYKCQAALRWGKVLLSRRHTFKLYIVYISWMENTVIFHHYETSEKTFLVVGTRSPSLHRRKSVAKTPFSVVVHQQAEGIVANSAEFRKHKQTRPLWSPRNKNINT